MFVARIIVKGDVVGYYEGSLVYVDQTKTRHKIKMYGAGVMQVAANTIAKWANELSEKVTYKERVEHEV